MLVAVHAEDQGPHDGSHRLVVDARREPVRVAQHRLDVVVAGDHPRGPAHRGAVDLENGLVAAALGPESVDVDIHAIESAWAPIHLSPLST